MKAILFLFFLFGTTANAGTWPTEGGTWTLVNRQCSDGTSLLAGPGTLTVEVWNETSFNLRYKYVHDLKMGEEFESTYCYFLFSYEMSRDPSRPEVFTWVSGNMVSAGERCLGNSNPDSKVKNEWRASNYELVSASPTEVVIKTLNNELCPQDAVVLNRFAPKI